MRFARAPNECGPSGASMVAPLIPNTPQPGGVQAWKILTPAAQAKPEPRTHEGYKRQYVLSGHMRADHRNTRRRRRRRQTVTYFPLHASTSFDAWRMRD